MKDNKIVSDLNTKLMVITFSLNEFIPIKRNNKNSQKHFTLNMQAQAKESMSGMVRLRDLLNLIQR